MLPLAHKLEKLGLNEKESIIYLATLEAAFGVSVATLSRKTGIKRSTVYLVLDALIKRGLVSISRKGNRHVYLAEDPRVFENILREQQHYLQGLLPELLSTVNAYARKPVIRFFEGTDGLKEVYRDTLSLEGDEILAWANPGIGEIFDAAWLTDIYVPERVKRNIRARAIIEQSDEHEKFIGVDASALREVRGAHESPLPFSIEINLYGRRKVALVAFKESFGLIIESEEIHNTLRAIFELGWASAGKGGQ